MQGLYFLTLDPLKL